MGTAKNVTPLTQLTLNLSKKKNVKKTSSRTVSLNSEMLPLKKLFNSVTLHGRHREVVQKFVKLFMNQLVLPGMNNTMLAKIQSNVKPSLKRNVRMSPKVTPPNKSVSNGQFKNVTLRLQTPRNTVHKPHVRRSHVKFVVLAA